MAVDFKGFISQHPAVVTALDDLLDAIADAAKDGLEVAIGAIPVVGGIAEKIAGPMLDEAEKKIDAALDAKLAELLGVPLVTPGSGVAGVVAISDEPTKPAA